MNETKFITVTQIGDVILSKAGLRTLEGYQDEMENDTIDRRLSCIARLQAKLSREISTDEEENEALLKDLLILGYLYEEIESLKKPIS